MQSTNVQASRLGDSMSAGGRASVALADPETFHARAISFNGPIIGSKTSLILGETTIPGWELVEAPLIDSNYRFMLRKYIEGVKDAAMYACVLVSDDGEDMKVCQFILIENDNEYERRGNQSYSAFSLESLPS